MSDDLRNQSLNKQRTSFFLSCPFISLFIFFKGRKQEETTMRSSFVIVYSTMLRKSISIPLKVTSYSGVCNGVHKSSANGVHNDVYKSCASGVHKSSANGVQMVCKWCANGVYSGVHSGVQVVCNI